MSKFSGFFQTRCGALLLAATGVNAQMAPDAGSQIQQRYEREVAACNAAALPTPARDACVRNAGAAADRARGGPPVEATLTTPDGRATVIAPPGAAPPAGDAPPASIAPPVGAAGTSTTPDGRATLVQPPTGRTNP